MRRRKAKTGERAVHIPLTRGDRNKRDRNRRKSDCFLPHPPLSLGTREFFFRDLGLERERERTKGRSSRSNWQANELY
jgi:hypothetical protein